MSNYIVDGADLTSVANAIRTKGGTSAQLAFPADFVSAVQAIPTGVTPAGTKQISITANGTTTEDVTNYANAEIAVNVPSADKLAVLASGVYTRTTSSGNLSIPISSFQGTIHAIYIEVASVTSNTAQFVATLRVFSDMFTTFGGVDEYFASGAGGRVSVCNRASDNRKLLIGNISDSAVAVDNARTQIYCYRPNGNTYPFLAGDYNWYIFGEASA